MEQIDAREFIHTAFQNCMERGWLKELVPSAVSMQDIAEFEEKYQVKLPALYRAFLTTYRLPEDMFQMCGIADHGDEISPLWLILYGISSMEQLSRHMESFREDVEEFRDGTSKSCSNLIPIGDWGAGWGPLCIDLTRAEESVNECDESTWTLVWFDHEEFDWGKTRLGADGLLHGSPAAPDLRTLLEWYFCGSLVPEFEAENQVKVSYERLNDMEFCGSYWEDRWK